MNAAQKNLAQAKRLAEQEKERELFELRTKFEREIERLKEEM